MHLLNILLNRTQNNCLIGRWAGGGGWVVFGCLPWKKGENKHTSKHTNVIRAEQRRSQVYDMSPGAPLHHPGRDGPTGYYKNRYQQSSREQMVKQSHAQTGSAWEVVLGAAGRPRMARAGADTQTQCWIFHSLMKRRRRQAQTAASPPFPAPLFLFLSSPHSADSLLPPLCSLSTKIQSVSPFPSSSLSLCLSFPPLCHFEKLQYGAGTLTDTDASPIRCTFLFDSVFGSSPPCPNLSQLCKKRKQKKKKDSTWLVNYSLQVVQRQFNLIS